MLIAKPNSPFLSYSSVIKVCPLIYFGLIQTKNNHWIHKIRLALPSHFWTLNHETCLRQLLSAACHAAINEHKWKFHKNAYVTRSIPMPQDTNGRKYVISNFVLEDDIIPDYAQSSFFVTDFNQTEVLVPGFIFKCLFGSIHDYSGYWND